MVGWKQGFRLTHFLHHTYIYNIKGEKFGVKKDAKKNTALSFKIKVEA